jgi:hypothetical protein
MNHIDPETLAAWSDDGLPSGERTAVEVHLADCAQCRAMAAAFGRTLDAPQAARVAAAPPAASPAKWILPFAATFLIAAGAAWNFWPRGETSDEPVQIAASAPAQQPAAPLPAAPVDSALPTAQAVPAPPAAVENAPVKSQQRKAEQRVEGVPAGVAGATAAANVQGLPPPAAAPPPPPPQPQPIAIAAPPPAAVAAPPPPIAASVQLRAMAPDRWQVIEFSSSADARFANVGAVAGGGAGRGGSARITASTSGTPTVPPVRWRATGPSAIERSLDNGATWAPVPIEGPTVVLTAGAAPTPGVCWFVGRGGAVLLSKDGGPFKRLAFPEGVDLTAIVAASDQRATVTASDGRSFATEDGGLTWRARF